MRSVIAAICLFAAIGVAAAQQPQDGPLNPIFACAGITDNDARLACYDAAVGTLRSAEQRGDVVAVDRTQAAEISRESFGFQIPSVSRLLGMGDEDRENEVALQVARVRTAGDGKAVITMTNGQVWRQIDGRMTRPLREGETVTVRRAALGSFLMLMPRGGQPLRVRREE